MEGTVECYESLLQQGATRLKGYERRLFMAEVTVKLWDGNPRIAERRFGWGRETVAKGLHELQQGVRCLNCLKVILQQALRMKWRGQHPTLKRLHGEYPDGVRLTKKDRKPYEARLQRSKALPKYDIVVRPKQPRCR